MCRPLVCAGGHVADAAISFSETVRVYIVAPSEQRPEKRNLVPARTFSSHEAPFSGIAQEILSTRLPLFFRNEEAITGTIFENANNLIRKRMGNSLEERNLLAGN
jgi:hypothetical protein